MKVGKLRTMLDEFDANDIVIISSDAEGNSFGPVATITSGYYIEDKDGFSGDFVDIEDVEQDDSINIEDSVSAIVLWPEN